VFSPELWGKNKGRSSHSTERNPQSDHIPVAQIWVSGKESAKQTTHPLENQVVLGKGQNANDSAINP
jgi:hypothetical protein